MKSYLMVYSKPIDGREDEYNEWYSNIHLQEVTKLEGIYSAQRFTLNKVQMIQEQAYQYLAMYEIDGESASQVIERLMVGFGTMNMSEALDLENMHISVFDSMTGLIQP